MKNRKKVSVKKYNTEIKLVCTKIDELLHKVGSSYEYGRTSTMNIVDELYKMGKPEVLKEFATLYNKGQTLSYNFYESNLKGAGWMFTNKMVKKKDGSYEMR